LLDAFYVARKDGIAAEAESWAVESAFGSHLEQIWREPDEGIWEVRSERQQFTHSKVMAWVAFDRAIRSLEESRLEGPLEHWRRVGPHG
jgi:GH15 family glucan-1,4-alpha-glucosidase